jgi:MoaA/NifB/PqqE/SkfB family radical SAM enzyme
MPKFSELVFDKRAWKFLYYGLKEKGIKWTYNYIHYYIFYLNRNSLLRKYLYKKPPYPHYIEIEVTTRCNLRCKMCEHTYWKEPPCDMSFEQFKSIIDQFPKLKWIGLTGIGESFVHKDFLKMLKYVKDRGIYVEIFDNFFLIDKEMSKQLIDIGVDRIILSIDAATKEIYEKIRVGSNFDKVIKNVKDFLELRAQKGAFFPKFEFHYIVNKDNIHETEKFIDLVHSFGYKDLYKGKTITFTRMLHPFKEIEDMFTDIPKELVERTYKKAKGYGMLIDWNDDVPTNKPPISHCKEWLMPFIFATGHVIPCCANNEANRREFQKATALGNVYEKPFKEIWNGEKYNDLRNKLGKNSIPTVCSYCCIYDLKKCKVIK